jgi:2-polyprenyl-3-methyl-5-hydroxy-6-metoxy-1,4-benzoquinol methylase
MAEPSLSRRPISGIDRIREMNFSYGPQRALAAGVQLGVFSTLAGGPKTAAAIAGAAGASERGMTMLLDALVALELLGKKGDRYELTADSARYLVRGSPDYAGAMLENDMLWEAWGHLAESVRSGKPWRSANHRELAEKFFPILIRTLHVFNRDMARRLAAALVPHETVRGLRVLDIGCGSAVWSIAIAERDLEAQVTALDLPAVLETTREYLAREGVLDQYELRPGDLHSAELEPSRYDLVLLGNIVHGESPEQSRELFRRIHKALEPGGRIAIIDMVPNDERTGPPFPLLFALNMLLNTDGGGTYTLAEYSEWLKEAGFAKVETVDIAAHSPAIVATKALLGAA